MLLIFHLGISCLWPVFKFRYFVPMLPLVFGLGAYGLFSIKLPLKTQNLLAIASVVGMVVVSLVTYLRVPSHTNYYDSNEFFRYRTGETEWLTEEMYLIDAAGKIKTGNRESPIMNARPALFYYVHRPIAITNFIQDPAIISSLVEEYDIQLILDQHNRMDFYAEFLDIVVIYANEKYAVGKILR
jgi:hypothetical protein